MAVYLEREEGLAECLRVAARERNHDCAGALLAAALLAVETGVWAAVFSSGGYVPPYYPVLAVLSLIASAGVVAWLFCVASRRHGRK